MRGIVTLAAALALPDGSGNLPAFPYRDLIVLTAFAVVLGTLVIQGFTLRLLLMMLGLDDDDSSIESEIRAGRVEMFRRRSRPSTTMTISSRPTFAVSIRSCCNASMAPADCQRNSIGVKSHCAPRQEMRRARNSMGSGFRAQSEKKRSSSWKPNWILSSSKQRSAAAGDVA